MSLTEAVNPLMMKRLVFGVQRSAVARTNMVARRAARCALAAPSFNGRTAASGAAYRGSNPWGAAKNALLRISANFSELFNCQLKR